MKVIVAYCQLHPKTVEAVWNSADELGEIAWGDTSGSDTAYFELLSRCWAEGETFIVLEQDKIPDQGALRELYDCEREWCTYPVPMAHNGQPYDLASLSCTKFSERLMVTIPNLFERVARMDMGYGLKHWNRLDMAIAGQLVARGHEVHWHEAGRVGHEHISLGVSA